MSKNNVLRGQLANQICNLMHDPDPYKYVQVSEGWILDGTRIGADPEVADIYIAANHCLIETAKLVLTRDEYLLIVAEMLKKMKTTEGKIMLVTKMIGNMKLEEVLKVLDAAGMKYDIQ